jgi:aspartate aminotransferase-like enzyme
MVTDFWGVYGPEILNVNDDVLVVMVSYVAEIWTMNGAETAENVTQNGVGIVTGENVTVELSETHVSVILTDDDVIVTLNGYFGGHWRQHQQLRRSKAARPRPCALPRRCL